MSNVAILIPAYGAADRLKVCLQSLARFAPLAAKVLVLDDGTPDDSIARCCAEQAFQNLTYLRSETNRGFVTTCNWGYSQIADRSLDILLLNSDTEATEGFLEEMVRVLHLHERHGVVTPRSNNATIFSVPATDPGESYAIWQSLKTDLPAYAIMPTAVGFCMLIKAAAIERFGLFDEIYSPGYNEENDFVCRINRYGYSALAANWAFVFHYEGATFGSKRQQLESRNYDKLVERYPEYERKVADYLALEIDPVETFAILRRQHRPSLFYDLHHLPAKHNGSSEFALNLLRDLYTQVSGEWDVFVGISEAARFFLSDLTGYELLEDSSTSGSVFDIAFKPAQILTWSEFRRMHQMAPRVSIVLQDIIAARSEYLAYPARKTIFSKTVELADQVYTVSRYSHADFEAYFGSKIDAQTIHHGTNAGLTAEEKMPGEYVLVVGNNFAHKGVKEAVACLKDVGPVRVLGGDRPDEALPDHIQWLVSGTLTRGAVRELYAQAAVIVFPSFYEGFGLPIVEGLALGKPVVAIDHELNRELAASFRNDQLILVRGWAELNAKVKDLGGARDDSHFARRWNDVARDYAVGLRALMETPIDTGKMRARSELVRVLAAGSSL